MLQGQLTLYVILSACEHDANGICLLLETGTSEHFHVFQGNGGIELCWLKHQALDALSVIGRLC